MTNTNDTAHANKTTTTESQSAKDGKSKPWAALVTVGALIAGSLAVGANAAGIWQPIQAKETKAEAKAKEQGSIAKDQEILRAEFALLRTDVNTLNQKTVDLSVADHKVIENGEKRMSDAENTVKAQAGLIEAQARAIKAQAKLIEKLRSDVSALEDAVESNDKAIADTKKKLKVMADHLNSASRAIWEAWEAIANRKSAGDPWFDRRFAGDGRKGIHGSGLIDIMRELAEWK